MKRSLTIKTKPCRRDDTFVAYVMGELSRSGQVELERHARTCPECRLRLASFKSAGSTLDRMFSKSPRRSDLAPAEKLLQAVLSQLPEQTLYYFTRKFSGFGHVLTAATERGLCFVSFREDAEDEYVDQWAEADFAVARSELALKEPMRQLAEYFAGKRKNFDLPIDLRFASEFTRKVLAETGRVSYGQVRTYLDIARRLKRPQAARAVGNALGRNPVPIVIPCHRVVATGGKLGGFTGGLDVKRKLLAIEGIEIDGGDLFG
jgi:methylated-DNA-[protein]-cysteine S-methyltransferase